MPIRYLFLMDPIESILPDKDTTFVFMLEAQARDHHAYYALPGDLFVRDAIPCVRARRTTVARATPHFSLFDEQTVALDWFDAIFMRKDPPVDSAYTFATHILSLAARRARPFILNNPRALRDANEKLYALNFPDLIPRSLVSSDSLRLKAFLSELGGEMIIKPLDGCGGAGIFHLRAADRNLNPILELATDYGRRLIMAQEYLPAVRAGDKRVILLNGAPLGAILRVPTEDENRGNIHVGGTCLPTRLTARDHAIVRALAPRLALDGLYFVGLDIIGDYLTEINVTSPTGVQEINRFDGITCEAAVLDFVQSRCASA